MSVQTNIANKKDFIQLEDFLVGALPVSGLSFGAGYLITKTFTHINPLVGSLVIGSQGIIYSLLNINCVFNRFLHSIDKKDFLTLPLSLFGSYFITKIVFNISTFEILELYALEWTIGSVFMGIMYFSGALKRN